MKTSYKFAYLAFLLPVLWSCDNYDMPPIIPQTGADITNPAQGSALELSLDDQDVMIPFSVTAADFGTAGEVTNVLQMDLPGASFANAVDLGSSMTTTIEVQTKKLNDALIAKGLPVDAAANAEFRVKSTFNQPMAPIVGQTLTLSVTPYSTFVPYPLMYVPGDHQGWNPGNLNTTLKSVGYNTTFTGFVHILTGSKEFKFTEQPAWVDGKNYGDTGADGKLDNASDAANIKVAEFGTYEMTVDLSSKTYTISAPKLWGVIGNATAGGWDAETPMNFNRDLNVLTLTLDLKVGDIKFRANQSWDYNLGPKDGKLVKDGDNIPIATAGNYTVTLDFNVPGEVSYTLKKN
ncbi:SusE domain-containing protein [Algoriphagus sp.]|uniref:SusF/SusE family outer membrane protein n=1 Tax=Algoriphagus sp. TaxID=1872435 RepID=UPI0032996D5E